MMRPTPAAIELRRGRFDWSRVYVMGVLNVTPDSFSDGGLYATVDAAVARGRELARAGADVIDIGGESTRPGATPVDAATEIRRVVPVIEALRDEAAVSVDTTKAEVARAALAAGAEIVNDISGGLFDPKILAVAADAGAVYVCGHVRGTSIEEVHAGESEPPVWPAVARELAARIAALPATLRRRTIADPGLGFGKGPELNLELIRRAGELQGITGCPVMIGPSRKRFVRGLLQAGRADSGPLALDSGTVGACLAAVRGGANFVRVHNIELLKAALLVYEASTSL